MIVGFSAQQIRAYAGTSLGYFEERISFPGGVYQGSNWNGDYSDGNGGLPKVADLKSPRHSIVRPIMPDIAPVTRGVPHDHRHQGILGKNPRNTNIFRSSKKLSGRDSKRLVRLLTASLGRW